MKTINQYLLILLGLSYSVFSSCNQFVEIPDSKNQIGNSIIFADSSVAASALVGAYLTMSTVNSSMKYTSLYTDEYAYTATNNSLTQFFQSRLSADNNDNKTLWSNLYSVIYQCNALMEGIDQTASLSVVAKKQLKAEAKFLRAFSYLYLVNFYDRIPLLLSTDVDFNRRAVQSYPEDIYDQIIEDLEIAKADLGPNYQGTGKVRANKYSASALLARVYLYQGRWSEAEKEAAIVIGSAIYSPLPKTEDVFLANSKETILQLWVVNGFVPDATQLVPSSSTALPAYTISDGLYTGFSATDNRKSKWITTNLVTSAGTTKPYNYPSKYKNRAANTVKPEYIMALRLGEQYLIRAEALAEQDNIAAAVTDLNAIRVRAGLLPLSFSISKQACLEAVASERRNELFGEWGHRFIDLKRTGQMDAVLSPLKSTYKPILGKVLPIPNTEIIYNSNLKQNEDY